MSKCRKMLFAAALLAFLSGARADVSEQWTSIALETLRDARAVPEAADRRLATVGQAIIRALAATAASANGNGNENGAGGLAAQRQRRDAAVAVAAFAVLESLYPEQREQLETRLALAFSYIPETLAKAEGAALGRRIANEVLAASVDIAQLPRPHRPQ
jgi:hypothetical protein